MYRRVALLVLSLGLGACQSPNPYTASSLPMPAAPPQAANAIDLSAYPAINAWLERIASHPRHVTMFG